MAATYGLLATYQAETGSTASARDAIDLEEASRAIDAICRQPAGYFAAASATKLFDVPVGGAARVWVPPLQSITTLKTDEDGDGTYEVTWATTDYRLYPLAGPPYTEIRVNAEAGRYRFPPGDARLQIVGPWGETASGAPLPIQKATRLLAWRWNKRVNTPEGIAQGSATMMAMGEQDPDIMSILRAGGYINHMALFA